MLLIKLPPRISRVDGRVDVFFRVSILHQPAFEGLLEACV